MKRAVRGLGIVIAMLALLAAAVYLFGGMWPRTPEMRARFDERVSAGSAAPVPAAFVIPIPGCVCHSDDPVLQAGHSVRRLRDCAQCHTR